MSGIYLSYRRIEAGGHAGRLVDHLSRHFGSGSVFRDIDTIRPGEDFAQAIESALNACDVVLVVIGNTWATGTGQDGRRRLDDPKDWVRLEVAAALRRNVLVIPVLVDGARLPDLASLPEELRPLCRRHACELTDPRWSYDVGELVKDIQKVIRPPQRFKFLRVNDKMLRWLTQGAIAFFLLLTVVLIGLPVLSVKSPTPAIPTNRSPSASQGKPALSLSESPQAGFFGKRRR
jgi:TIR domain